MSDMTKRLFEDPELLEQAKEDFRKRTGGRPYICPIPKGEGPLARKKRRQEQINKETETSGEEKGTAEIRTYRKAGESHD